MLKGFLASLAAAARGPAELRSRELLVVWAALCMADGAARAAHPALMKPYGVAVDWSELRHLLACDAAATAALRGCADYLRQHTVLQRPLFSLRDGGAASFAFAQAFAAADSRMLGTWHEEQTAAQARQAAHWQEVQRKQRLAAQLRQQLAQKKAAEEAARQAHSKAYAEHGYHSYECRAAQSRLSTAQRQVSSTEGKLSAALQPPEPVIQPLPQGQQRALQWLFFLYMPPLFRCVGWSFLCCRMYPARLRRILSPFPLPSAALPQAAVPPLLPGAAAATAAPAAQVERCAPAQDPLARALRRVPEGHELPGRHRPQRQRLRSGAAVRLSGAWPRQGGARAAALHPQLCRRSWQLPLPGIAAADRQLPSGAPNRPPTAAGAHQACLLCRQLHRA